MSSKSKAEHLLDFEVGPPQGPCRVNGYVNSNLCYNAVAMMKCIINNTYKEIRTVPGIQQALSKRYCCITPGRPPTCFT